MSPKCIGSYSGKIVILDSVFYKGVVRPVKNINSNAFYRNNDIDSVEIAGSVDEISFTFNECKNLKDVVLHEGIKRIGKNTFAGYIGYIYANGRVILDRFYDKQNDSNLALGHAVYAMNMQEFYELSKLSKTEIIRNNLCRRYVHRGNWKKRF